MAEVRIESPNVPRGQVAPASVDSPGLNLSTDVSNIGSLQSQALKQEGRAAIAGTVLQGLAETASAFAMDRAKRLELAQKEAAEQAKQETFTAAGAALQTAYGTYKELVNTGQLESNPNSVHAFMSSALLNIAASPRGATLKKADYDVFNGMIKNLVDAEGEQWVNFSNGLAHIVQRTPEGYEYKTMASSVTDWDRQLEFEALKTMPIAVGQIANDRDSGRINEDEAQTRLQRIIDDMEDLEHLNMRVKKNDALGKIDALNPEERTNTGKAVGFDAISKVTKTYMRGLSDGSLGNNFEQLSHDYKSTMEEFLLSDSFVNLATAFKMDIDVYRDTFKRYIDTTAEVIRESDPLKLSKRETDTQAQAILQLQQRQKFEELQLRGEIPVTTRFVMEQGQKLYTLSFVSQMYRRTTNKDKPVSDISNAILASESRFREMRNRIQENLTAEFVDTERGLIEGARLVNEAQNVLDAWERGDYLAHADAAGLAATMQDLLNSPVLQTRSAATVHALTLQWNRIKELPQNRPIFEVLEGKLKPNEFVQGLIDNGFLQSTGDKLLP
jgi:hypothetical protein